MYLDVYKIVGKHLLGSFVVYAIFATIFTISASIHPAYKHVMVDVAGVSSKHYGPISVEYLRYPGAGSGEYGGCARNYYYNATFLFGVENLFCGVTEGQAGLIFYTLLGLPFVLVIALMFFAIGFAFDRKNLIHNGMIPIDAFIVIMLFDFLWFPIFSFVGPFQVRTLG